ncbi:hypothetical protein F5X97DRAFT_328698 [Nemania serpens]|nr:hypothetical protein F5X97DRAFT_328698 [Nemania serpens]
MKNDTNAWRRRDPIPPAFDPCRTAREEQEYDLALSNPNRCFGKGTTDDPQVIWIERPDHLNRNLVWAHNNFAKAIAKLLGLTHTWIIKCAHNLQYERDTEGRRMSTPPHRYLLRDADMHITLRLGTGLYACRLSARAYVALDKSGNPEKYMTELTRRFRREHRDARLEFSRWSHGRRRVLSRRALNLGHNWEVHANVGPYLDTYRPQGRRTRETYMSRRRPDHEYEYEGGNGRDFVIDGAKTPELAALVSRCHAAYDEYRAFHRALVADMEKGSSPEIETEARRVELYLMSEQVATMKREVYREAQRMLV